MKTLENGIITEILKEFNCNLGLIKTLEYEPDCYIYFLIDKNKKNYILVCRDLIQDDPGAEKRILKDELDIEILERIKTKSNDYWLRISGLDDFEYVFSLNRVL